MLRFSLFALMIVAASTCLSQSFWAPLPQETTSGNNSSLRPLSGGDPAFWFLPDILGAGPAVYSDVAPEGYTLAESQSCVTQVVSYDPYCLDTGWDDLCEEEYLCCMGEDEQLIIGCTNPLACNFDPNVCVSQPISCVFCLGSCFFLTLTDSYGDGWNGATWSFTDGEGIVVANGTMADGFNALAADCIDDGCYEFEVSGGFFPDEIGWTLVGSDLGTLSGGANESVAVSFNGTSGCTSPNACNYDEGACSDDGSCEFLQDGATDMTAHSWELFYDFGCDGEVDQVTLYFAEDFTAGDSDGTSAPWSLCSDVLTLFFDGEVGYVGSWDGLGFVGDIVNPLVGCFELYPTGLGCTDPAACNFDAEATVFDGSCTYPGCMNPLACNYDAFAGCEGPCDLPGGYLLGCTNPNSSNHDPTATVDDGSCDLSYMCLEGTVYDPALMGCVPAGCPGDLNFDDEIDVNDLLEFLLVYDSLCE
ncbi:MAG: hypothetical protein O2791_04255 [Bacteroidetes bacterium]|nr:hypothetical protein [Bacteroidota bacterium]